MKEIVYITLENEMDLILSNKKAVKLAEQLNLSNSTQTTFATAVSEIAREIIECTDQGSLSLGVIHLNDAFFLTARILYPHEVSGDILDEGYAYAKKLVPSLETYQTEDSAVVELKMKIPRSSRIDVLKLRELQQFFESERPYTPYEEIKKKYYKLNLIAEERYEKLLQSQYINDRKNEFISIASHELKTPVTIIKAFSQIALTASGNDQCSEKVKGYLTKIESQASRLTSLIQQLLDVSNIEHGKLNFQIETVNVRTYLQETLALIQQVVPKHQLNILLKDDALVDLDRARMEQVMANIIGNAAKYSAPESQIDITMHRRDSMVVISITDHGIGMDSTNLKKIFEKFHREETVINNYSGLGLGLYISSKIMAGHKGKIEVESEIGHGSTFRLHLPVADELS
ncbi:MAG TPA: sensor histidine kinase [Sphingobacteriaceae bacterium]